MTGKTRIPLLVLAVFAAITLAASASQDTARRAPTVEDLMGLEDRGVPVEMVVYKGYGGGITKPKSMRAVMAHNLARFGHYVLGHPKPDLAAPPVPKKANKDDKKGDKP